MAQGSHTIIFLVSFSVVIGAITAFILYKTAYLRKEVSLRAAEQTKSELAFLSGTSAIHEKIKKLQFLGIFIVICGVIIVNLPQDIISTRPDT